MREKEFINVSQTTEIAMSISGIWLLIITGLVRSLLSTHKRGLSSVSLCGDFSDLTSPTSNHYILLFPM